ncbi:DNA polymerase III subunit gamma/tau [Ketobacter sp.]|uniref:DNA polymerase III subunit gamma/tau n=1 Tax=Ketobacter sp. TaxID=2083498 RepID=UPI000F23AB8C|nr:DNA polymerase III subunit gamma/tau [Ketobacter sp.]RLT99297.1 MAG: DNA polymerase III subunit gamma/tau [Ketobacter sp.]
MSYQVLARKWRPKTFREMVGQEHVLKALINALDHGRLHHAYLFTGTRGVGKTTIARILAKSLNCETGISSEPCGQCSACQEINDGRFVDLIEVDAASRTKVEDTRELLENVQYAPTRGRYKVYLIDEVHMLSGHSFNALLKTLEEPPEHVKFLLATTDPQKLPITILSRCLQFSLKAMTPERIVGHLKKVLEAEMVEFEEPALWQLGRAADGSMRDAMSLTDQAIAFGSGKVVEADVRAMLGSIDREYVFGIVEALAQNSAEQLLQRVADMAEQSPDYMGVLADLISTLHRMAVAQIAPDAVDDSDGDRARVLECSARFAPEQLQLFYQTALLGRRDLPLAPDARSGFEMTLLRLLLFKPVGVLPAGGGGAAPGKSASPAVAAGHPSSHPATTPEAPAQRQATDMPARSSARAEDHLSQMRAALANPAPGKAHPEEVPPWESATAVSAPELAVKPVPIPAPASPPQPAAPAKAEPQAAADTVAGKGKPSASEPPASETTVASPALSSEAEPAPAAEATPKHKTRVIQLGDEWADLVGVLELDGPVRNFARNCSLESTEEGRWTLAISPRFQALYKEENRDLLAQALSANAGRSITLRVEVAEPGKPTPDQLLARYKQQRKEQAIALMQEDAFVQDLQNLFGATLDLNSVLPVDDD